MDAHRDMEELLQKLKDVIRFGDSITAKQLVSQLAKDHLKLNIDVAPEQRDLSLREKHFNVTVEVEDRQCAGASFKLQVKADDKVEDLKRKVWLKYQFPMEVQRWIIKQRIAEDRYTLHKYGITEPTTLHLYLLPACRVGLNPKMRDAVCFSLMDDSKEPFELVDIDDNVPRFTTLPTFDTLQPFNPSPQSTAANEKNRDDATIPKNIDSIEVVESINENVRVNIMNGEENVRRVPEEQPQENVEPIGEEESDDDETVTADQAGWTCPFCTYANPGTQQICNMCYNSPLDDNQAVGGEADNQEHHELVVGERVVWMSDNGAESGIVKWIGRLPDTEGITVGVDFDNPVGSGSGKYKDQRLFFTNPGHASLIPLSGLFRERDFPG